jgi:hypothetical protein
MRALLVFAAVAGLLTSAGTAGAAGGGKIYQNWIGALNNLIEAPTEPIMQVIEPPGDFDEDMPGYPVTPRIFGFFSGTAMAIYRITGAAYDIVVSPFWIFPVLSPEPRWELIPGAEYE